MKKLLIILALLSTYGFSLIAFEESCEGTLCPKLMQMDDVPDEIKELALMYRGIEMDIEDLEDDMEEVSSDVKELKEMVKELTTMCKKIQKEVSKK